LTGWRFAVSSAAVFLLPLATALVGAASIGGGEGVQFLGALGGLAVGLGAGLLISRLVARAGKDAA